jgi:hypothetical protein
LRYPAGTARPSGSLSAAKDSPESLVDCAVIRECTRNLRLKYHDVACSRDPLSIFSPSQSAKI